MKRKMKKMLSMILALAIVLSSVGFESNAASFSNRRKQFDKMYIPYALNEMYNLIEDSHVSYASKTKLRKSELTPKQKKYYEYFAKKFENLEDFYISDESDSYKKRDYKCSAYTCFLDDHPEYKLCCDTVNETTESGKVICHHYFKTPSGKRVKTAKDKKALKKYIKSLISTRESVADHIIEMMPENLSTIDKYRYLAVVLCYSTKYNQTYYDNHTNYSRVAKSEVWRNASTKDGPLLYGTAVCSGYSEAYKYLCNRAGLYCETVIGQPKKIGTGGHEWNIVKLKSGTYYVDVTWMDTLWTSNINYNHFIVTEKEMRQNHSEFTWSGKVTGKKSYRKIIEKVVNPEV